MAQLLNSNIAAMEELTICDANKDDFNKQLGGEEMHIAVKHESNQEIPKSTHLRQLKQRTRRIPACCRQNSYSQQNQDLHDEHRNPQHFTAVF